MKYEIDPSYRFLKHIKTPMNPFLLHCVNGFLTVCPKGMMSTKSLKIEKKKIHSSVKGEILTYHIEPKNSHEKILPCLLFFHGGGFVMKGFYHHYRMARIFAKDVPCKVIYVDYRLHHQLPFPGCISDCMDAYLAVLEHAEEWHIDKERIAFGGDSAGGYLSELLLLQTKEKKIDMPCFTLLMYPFLDQRLMTPSQRYYVDTPLWNGALSDRMCNQILYRHHVLSPSEYEDLSFLPPCYIDTAEFDSLHDEAHIFAQRLLQANNQVKVYDTKGTIHGFDVMWKSKITKAAMQQRILSLQQAFYKKEE